MMSLVIGNKIICYNLNLLIKIYDILNILYKCEIIKVLQLLDKITVIIMCIRFKIVSLYAVIEYSYALMLIITDNLRQDKDVHFIEFPR